MFKSNILSNFHKLYFFKRRKHRQTISKIFPSPNYQAKLSDSGPYSLKWMQKMKLIHQEFPGCHYLLPNLQKSFEKLVRLIDYEMSSIGAYKISMPCLSQEQAWRLSGRWESIGNELYKIKDRHNSSLCLSPTHEEAVTMLVAEESPVSYRRLPLRIYQIGRKFRDEIRPKNGLLRSKEFEMKDLYTFDESHDDSLVTFNEVIVAYSNIFKTIDIPFLSVDASTGVMGGHTSKEFHVLSSSGEDTISYCHKCAIATNKELINSNNEILCQNKSECHLKEEKGIEVAHAFILGTKYSEIFGATFVDRQNKKKTLNMGCYGIGVTRLLAAVVEVSSTTNDRLVWPAILASHLVVIISQKEGYKSEATTNLAFMVYDNLTNVKELKNEVLIDDRLHLSIGQRIKDAYMSAIPYIIVIGKKALEDPIIYEVIETETSNKQYLELSNLIELFNTCKIKLL